MKKATIPEEKRSQSQGDITASKQQSKEEVCTASQHTLPASERHRARNVLTMLRKALKSRHWVAA